MSAPIAARAEAGLRVDLLAGLTGAAVVVPKAMAYATVAGLPVSTGLYTAFVPLVVYALLGSSRVLSTTTTTTLAILTGAELAAVVPDGDPARLLTAAATLACLVGLVLMLAGVMRLGVVANLISESVLTGFKAGVGCVIVLDQLPKLLGVHFDKGNFAHNLWALLQALPHTSLMTLAVGGGTLLLLLLMERWKPHSPLPLLAVALAIVLAWGLDLPAQGVESIGRIPQGLPGFVLPDLALLQALLPGALGIGLMSFTESIAVGRAFARSGEPPVSANRELLATGAANLAGGLFGAMPGGGGTSQTAVIRALGARSQWASVATAGTAAAVMLFLAPALSHLPQATLAAVVIVYSAGLIQPGEFLAIRRVRNMEFNWALVAFAGVLLVGTLQGILVAIVASLLGLLRQSAQPRVSELLRKPGTDIFRPAGDANPDDERLPGLLIVRPEDRIFFANAQHVREALLALLEARRPQVLLLDLSAVPDVEYSALKLLHEAAARAHEMGLEMWLSGLTPKVLEVVRSSGLAATLGDARMFFNVQSAAAAHASRPPSSSAS